MHVQWHQLLITIKYKRKKNIDKSFFFFAKKNILTSAMANSIIQWNLNQTESNLESMPKRNFNCVQFGCAILEENDGAQMVTMNAKQEANKKSIEVH